MRTTSFRKFFFFFPYRFQPVGPSPRKIRKNKTRTDNNNNNSNNNKKKGPLKLKIHGARLGTPKNGGGAMSSQFSISTFTFAPGVLFCLFFFWILFCSLFTCTTPRPRLSVWAHLKNVVVRFSFRSVRSVAVTDRPRQSRDAKQKRPGPKEKPISSAIIMVGQLREKGEVSNG